MTKEIIAEAKQAVKGNWWRIVGTSLLLALCVGVLSIINVIPVIGTIAYFISVMLLTVGFSYYCYNVSKGGGKVTDLFVAFKNSKLAIDVLKLTGICFLIGVGFGLICVILALIPFIGILAVIAFYIYFLCYVIYFAATIYILFENPNITVIEAMKKSKELVKGHRWTWIWMQIRLILIPLLLIIGTMIVSFCLLLVFKEAIIGAFIGMGLMVLGILVSYVWLIILIPASCLLSPIYYEKVKKINSGSIENANIDVTPYQ